MNVSSQFRSIVVAVALARATAALAGTDAPMPSWRDEFDGEVGSTPKPSHWVYDLGGNGWGNNEHQTYTKDPANASIVDDPEAVDGKALAIRAIKSADGAYTSARLKTLGKFAPTLGRIEARLKMTNGQGIWPAFWMLGANIEAVHWPKCGEIDVIEVINANPREVHGTLHGPGYSGANGLKGSTTLASGTLDQAYHVYAIDWSRDKIVWSFDGIVYHTETSQTIPAGTQWVFNAPFFLLLNLAVGGNWPGNPDATTPFPQTYSIDYIRVYEPSPEPSR